LVIIVRRKENFVSEMLLVISRPVLLLTMIGLVESNVEFVYDDDDDINPCDDFYDTDSAGECHNSRLPSQSLQNIYGPNVRRCCPENSYRFHDNCQASEPCELQPLRDTYLFAS
jgi:hypothetical protein